MCHGAWILVKLHEFDSNSASYCVTLVKLHNLSKYSLPYLSRDDNNSVSASQDHCKQSMDTVPDTEKGSNNFWLLRWWWFVLRLLPGICLFSLCLFQSPCGIFARLSLTKPVCLSPLSRWQQGQEGAHMDRLWTISSPWRHGQWIVEDLKLPKNTGAIAASTKPSSKGSWAPNLLCPVLLQPYLRSSDWDRLHSNQPVLSHHLVNLLLEEKSSSIVVLELD